MDTEDLGRLLGTGHVGPVQAEHLTVVTVEVGHDHQGVAAVGGQQAAEDAQGGGRVTGVDGVGQVPRSERSGVAQEGLELGHRHRGPRAIGGGQHVEQPGQPAHVRPEMVGRHLLGGGVESHRTGPEMLGQPLRAVATGATHRGVDHLPGGAGRLGQGGGDGLPSATEQDQGGGGEGVLQVVGQPAGVGGGEVAGVAHHHHPPLDQEGRGGTGVDDRPHIQLVGAGGPELLDHQGGVVVPHQLLDQGVGGLGHQGGVVPLDQGDRRRAHLGGRTGGAHRPPPATAPSVAGRIDTRARSMAARTAQTWR